MKVIGICGRKGGSGKTTTAVHLAAELAARGKRVMVVDCDMQGSATYWAEPGNLPMPVEHMPIETEKQVFTWSDSIRALDADFIVLDSPPHLNEALGAVIGLSDMAVIPCGPSGLDLIATGETVSLVREIRAARGGKHPRIVLVPNRADRRTSSGKELSDALTDLKEPVAPVIGSRTAFSDAFNNGDWVGAFAPNSPAHTEMKSLADFVLKQLRRK
ncbi:MAG TPA: ParA family protein [Rhodospirillales bacterium]|jgi:chromosome partitioning protein|nr:ParA family protein [Rhodospirillales bacterium]|tara:strand:- start:326 stop:973 length:648 start_codon:yes stop_codon:yes gene_type:complete